MKKVTPISERKSDHIRINLENDVRSGVTTGLEKYRFFHRALPEINLEDVDLGLEIFGKRLQAPILISSMTGGTQEAAKINQNLAVAAQESGIAIGVGSQRAAIENPKLASTFQLRKFAPEILLFANLGAIQLNYGYGIQECRRAVEMIEADALILHLNALQEAVQPEGDTRFSGLCKKIEDICRNLQVPVIAKEVGWGFSEADIHLLLDAGVSAIDVAGAGGTSWSQVEMYRAKNPSQARLAAAFVNWGIPTADAIQNVRIIAPGLKVIASGGLRSGVDLAKCLALGAAMGGLASPFLKAAAVSAEETITAIHEIRDEMQVCMFACGAKDLESMAATPLLKLS
ncbi:MAG: type 2 isopentenyl-diphosphate Delta-isomerase [candidate division Zixibacteria bacterium RBG_16_50_21]|nr:MAG: type 2 isopentenyl-diphosphate Delta-isomerase [candidate division Zixibacteria bacterium RBG_16_50_21]